MKRILFLLFLIPALARSQYPVNTVQGSPGQLLYQQGSFGAMKGFVWKGTFTDTAAANLSFIANVPGQTIRVVDTIFMRSNDGSKWINITGGVYYTKTQINSFFGGTASIAGYNKANWDAAYASWSAAQALSPAGWATQSALVDTANALRAISGGGGGSGDMTKAVYDPGNNGVVDNSEALEGNAGSYYLTQNTGLRGVSIPSLSVSGGFLKYTGTGTNTWVFDANTYLTSNLYTANGTLTGNRTITGSNFYLALTGGRFQESKGANVTAANNLSLGADGNTFTITGNTQINAITNTNWQAGSKISLIFTGSPTIKHNTAGGAGTSVILLSGSADYSAAADDVLQLVYDGTSWHETTRKVVATGGGRMVYPGAGIPVSTGSAWSTSLTGTANQLLRRNAANTAFEFFTPPYLTSYTETDPNVDAIIKAIPVSADAATNKYLNWNGSAYVRKQIAYSEISGTPDLSGYVPTSRTLTINGTTLDLSANRSWTVSTGSGTVNSGTQYRLGYYATTGTAISEAAAITGSRALVSDANGVPTHSATTATQIGYLSTTTSDVQTQINNNRDSLRKRYLGIRAINDTMFALQKWNGTATTEDTVVISLANGNKNEITVNNGWTDWTINNGVVTNAKLATGIDAIKIADGSVNNTEFQYINSVTSNVQTQINGKQPNLQYKDEGTNVGSAGGITSVNFTGSGVTATQSSGALTVNIPGGGGTSSGTFKEIRFKWGVTTNAPASGDSVLQHDTLIGKDIEVYREGELQDSTSQYIFNNTTGTITFRPAEFTGERNTIKVYPSGTRTSVALTTPASFATTNRVALYTNTSKTVVGTDVTKWANADGNTALDYSQSDSGYPQDGGSNGLTFDGIAARKLYMTSIPTTQSAPITIYMRVKVNAFPSALFAPSGSAYGVFFDVSNTYFNPAGSGYGVVTSGISSATWHTVVITWDGSTANKVYVDGTLLGTAGGSPSGSALDFAILNAQSAGTYFNGNVLGLAIFSAVHDATTVATQTPLFNTVVQ
jgi:hypothetical protein